MRNSVALLLFTMVALGLIGCAATPVVHVWKAPADRVALGARVAVVAVEDRFAIREGVENRFVRELAGQGQDAIPTHDLLSLQEIKSNPERAAARLAQEGAHTVLIVYVLGADAPPLPEGVDARFTGLAWHDCFAAAFTTMAPLRGTTWQKFYLEASCSELNAASCLWTARSVTTLKDDGDKLDAAEQFARKLAAALRKARLMRQP